MQLPPALLEKYIEHRHSDLQILRQALLDKDHEPPESIGHRLKGSGPAYGYSELGELGAALQLAARNGDFEAIETLLDQLEDWLAQTQPAAD